MKTIIKCQNPNATNRIYNILTDPNKGTGSLKGKKTCVDDHTQIPTMMSFDLSKQEAEDLKKVPGVVLVKQMPFEPKPILFVSDQYIQSHRFRLASYIEDPEEPIMPDIAPHSVYCSTQSEPPYTHDSPLLTYSDAQDVLVTNCSNVDIIIVDSGIDSTHPDFISTSDGSSRVIDFDWGIFTELDGDGNEVPIISNFASIRENWLKDWNGHGTGCASLAAGNRCGLAKQANLYSVKIFSGEPGQGDYNSDIGTVSALKLVLAFLQAKSANLHGLDSTRPTIISNSWGYTRYEVNTADMFDLGISTEDQVETISKIAGTYNLIGGPEITDVDTYVRAIVAAGGHFLHAAGNDNAYVDYSSDVVHEYHMYGPSEDYLPTLIPSLSQTDEFFNNVEPETYYTTLKDEKFDFSDYALPEMYYFGKASFGCYASPGVGIGEDKNTYPVITVGDLSPVGFQLPIGWDSVEAEVQERLGSWPLDAWREPYLSDSDDNKLIMNETVRQRNHTDRKYVKSYYSNFGPGVDIYATGNDTIAAKAKQLHNAYTYVIGDDTIVDGDGNELDKYRYFNGTSAATPIVAGVLATWLTNNPTATPLEARDWLLANATKGNILETATVNKPLLNVNGDVVTVPVSNLNYTKNVTETVFFDDLGRDNFLMQARFYNSANAVALSHPLQNAVLNSDNAQETVALTQLTLSETGLTVPETHTL